MRDQIVKQEQIIQKLHDEHSKAFEKLNEEHSDEMQKENKKREADILK